MNNKILNLLPIIIFIGAISLTAFLCITVQGNYAVNGNISWLLMGAERLLEGKTMVEHIYEPNPPMSLIIYIPHVIFSKLVGVSLPIGSFYITLAFALLSILASYQIIKRYSFLEKPEKLGFIACYAIAATLTNVVFYSEREHIMLLAIVPFMLVQFALMEKITLPKRLSIPVLIIGALGFLIKPHYGLVPTIFLLARIIKYRSINPIKHPDFLALSAMTLLYLGIVLTMFDDYIHTIFPDLLSYYIGSGQNYLVVLQASTLQTLLYISVFLLEVFLGNHDNTRDRFIRFLYLCAILNLFPYYVQMKGYSNHLIPANSFFMIAICCSVMLRLTPFMKDKLKWKKTYTSSLSIIIPFICVFGISNTLIPLNNDFPTHKDMRELPVAKYLKQHCKQPCSFYAFHTDMEIMPSTAALMEYEFASRFGVLWTIPSMLEKMLSDDPEIRKNTLHNKERYSRYLYEDLEFYKPSLLLIAKDVLISINNTHINFIDFFAEYEPLRSYIDANFVKGESFEYDRSQYFKGTTLDYPYTLYYDVYVRKE